MALTQVTYPDNEKILVGTSDDLQIWHDGSNSIIKDAGTGGLQFWSNDFRFYNAAGDEYLATGAEGGAVSLYHANVKKFETTSDGGTVSGDLQIGTTSAHTKGIEFADATRVDAVSMKVDNSDDSDFDIVNNRSDGEITLATNSAERMRIDSSGKIGVGVTSPAAILSIVGGESATPRFAIQSAGGDHFTMSQYEDGNGVYTLVGQNAQIDANGNEVVIDSGHKTASINFDGRNNGALIFNTGDTNAHTERMRIDKTGAITVGTRAGIHGSNALARFGIDCQDYDALDSDANNVDNYGLAFYNSSTTDEANGIGFFNDDGTTCGGYIVHQDKGGSNIGDLVFGTASSANTPVERMRIDSSGKVIVSGQCDATCFTGDSGTSYGYTEISSSNATVTTGWTQVDSSHEWALPGAGVYKLEASVRVRIDDVVGYIKARYSGSAANGLPLMLFETNDSDTMYNSNAHIMWVYTATGADTVELQFASSVNDDGLSIQNDVNGRAFMLWTRIG